MASLHALIIDDDANNMAILESLLEESGIASTKVSNPQNLDQLLQPSATFDLVFVDLEMPELNGYQVLEKIRSNPRLAATPVVAHSVHLNELTRTHSSGFSGFIGKPVDAEQFTERVLRILNGEAVWET